MASLQAKTGQERLKKEKKIIVLISSYLTRNREFQNNSKKIKNIEKHHYDFFSSQNGTGHAENEKKKLSFQSVTTWPGIENSKKIAKKFKKLKNIIMSSFEAKMVQEWSRNREKKKIIVPISSFSNWNREWKKKLQKNSKNLKHPNGFISRQNGTGEVEKERKKNLSFQSVPN